MNSKRLNTQNPAESMSEISELSTGQPRTEPHRDRREIAADKWTSAKKRRVRCV
jgi:hypothetical protein